MSAITPSTSSTCPATPRRRPRYTCRRRGLFSPATTCSTNAAPGCCDPWEWLGALDQIAALDVETIVPGHGEPCGKGYLKEQAQIVENWVGFIETYVDRGVDPEGILKEPLPVTQQDPYPIGQRLFMHDERLTGMIVRNLHRRILERKGAAAPAPPA